MSASKTRRLEEVIAEVFSRAGRERRDLGDRGLDRGGGTEKTVTILTLMLHSPLHRLATSWTILRIAVEERLIYRVDFALGTLMRFLPIVTQIFLWAAVFAGMSRSSGSRNPSPATPTTTSSPTTC